MMTTCFFPLSLFAKRPPFFCWRTQRRVPAAWHLPGASHTRHGCSTGRRGHGSHEGISCRAARRETTRNFSGTATCVVSVATTPVARLRIRMQSDIGGPIVGGPIVVSCADESRLRSLSRHRSLSLVTSEQNESRLARLLAMLAMLALRRTNHIDNVRCNKPGWLTCGSLVSASVLEAAADPQQRVRHVETTETSGRPAWLAALSFVPLEPATQAGQSTRKKSCLGRSRAKKALLRCLRRLRRLRRLQTQGPRKEAVLEGQTRLVILGGGEAQGGGRGRVNESGRPLVGGVAS